MSRISYTRPSSYKPLSKKNSKCKSSLESNLRAEAATRGGGSMAFLLRAISSGSENDHNSLRLKADTENARRAFRIEQENILRRVEAEDEELQSLVERIYDTSFPESQKFLKNPTKERVKAHTDTVCRLLSGLSSQDVPVTRLLLDVVTKHGITDRVHEPLITLLEMVRPLLSNKDIPDFTSDDLLDAIDNQWHSGINSVKSSPAIIWGTSANSHLSQSCVRCRTSKAALSPRSCALRKTVSSTSLPVSEAVEEKTHGEFSSSPTTIAHESRPLTLPLLRSFSDENFASSSSYTPLGSLATHGSHGTEDLENCTQSVDAECIERPDVKLTFKACGIPEVLQPLEDHSGEEHGKNKDLETSPGIPKDLQPVTVSVSEEQGLDQTSSGMIPEVLQGPVPDHGEEHEGLGQTSSSGIPELLRPVPLENQGVLQELDQSSLTSLLHGFTGGMKILPLVEEAEEHQENISTKSPGLVPMGAASNLEISSPQIPQVLDCAVASTCNGEAHGAVDQYATEVPGAVDHATEGKGKLPKVPNGKLELATEWSVSRFGTQDSCCKGIEQAGQGARNHDLPSMNSEQLLLDDHQPISPSPISPERIQHNFEDSGEMCTYPFVRVPQCEVKSLPTAANREEEEEESLPSLNSCVQELGAGGGDAGMLNPTDVKGMAELLSSSSMHSGVDDVAAANLGTGEETGLFKTEESNSNSPSMVVPTSHSAREEIELESLRFYKMKQKLKTCWWWCCFCPSANC
ncbi:unnamed protein product [Sphagnum troendelagicum]|uniref:Uncharacterized protein n=1 Tax=Sphagnum troendelagicum TaxID=128251 RepID=A0ABP0TU99_9BRYO